MIIVVARGITVVMKNAYMTDTILNKMESAVSGTSSGAFAIVAFLVNIPIAFLVPSSSGTQPWSCRSWRHSPTSPGCHVRSR